MSSSQHGTAVGDLLQFVHYSAYHGFDVVVEAIKNQLHSKGYDLSLDEHLQKRLEFHCLTSKCRSKSLSYSNITDFRQLLQDYDKVFRYYYTRLKSQISFYDWFYQREKIILQLCLPLLCTHFKQFETMRDFGSFNMDSICLPKNFSLVNFENELYTLLADCKFKWPFTLLEKKIYDESFKGKVFEKMIAITSKNKLDKTLIFDLFYSNKLEEFEANFTVFIHKVEQNVLVVPTLTFSSAERSNELLKGPYTASTVVTTTSSSLITKENVDAYNLIPYVHKKKTLLALFGDDLLSITRELKDLRGIYRDDLHYKGSLRNGWLFDYSAKRNVEVCEKHY